MIRTVIGISALRLWHNKGELLLTFIVPIVFFSIFAWIFGARGSQPAPKLKVVLCDEVRDEHSARLVRALAQSETLLVQRPRRTAESGDDPGATIPLATAEQLVKRGTVSAAIVLLRGQTEPQWLADKRTGTTAAEPIRIEVLTDSFDLVATKVVAPLVQKVVVSAESRRLSQAAEAESRLAQTAAAQPALAAGGPAAATVAPADFQAVPAGAVPVPAMAAPVFAPPVMAGLAVPDVSVRDILGATKSNPVIAMYAAGIAVMFLLFSTTTASGSLLEEKENSTLERLLSSHLTMDQLLLGKWCYLTLLGCAQTTLMFVAGAVFFRLNLLEHLAGFAIMTAVTAGAASSFALMMAAVCRTRTQLGWLSTILILSMSALGGSMVPRYVMGENIRRVGQFTFNAWALDGYNKVFWRELPLVELRPELTVLAVCGLLFIIVARLFATRWDRG
jgi:ABC-2 type transport system permease protein